jgi:hypothetical protein
LDLSIRETEAVSPTTTVTTTSSATTTQVYAELMEKIKNHKVFARHPELKRWVDLVEMQDSVQRAKILLNIFDGIVSSDETKNYYESYDNSGFDYDHI